MEDGLSVDLIDKQIGRVDLTDAEARVLFPEAFEVQP